MADRLKKAGQKDKQKEEEEGQNSQEEKYNLFSSWTEIRDLKVPLKYPLQTLLAHGVMATT